MPIPVSRRLDFSEIPQIDVWPLLTGGDVKATVVALRAACTDVGFFYVRNHGVPGDLIAELRSTAQRFFERPFDEKCRVHLNARMQGYLPLDYSSYKGEATEAKSHQEGFWMGYERAEGATCFLDGPNLWPEGHDDLCAAMKSYQQAVEPLTAALIHGFAVAANLDPARMTACFAKPLTRLKLNHYPPQDNPESVRHIGVVPHADSDAFTILWQDEGDGLEIQNLGGEWIGAPSIPNTFVVNIGNIMQIWTSGRFRSTPHRVINRGGRDRYSIPVFVYPDADVPVAAMDAAGRTDDGGVTTAEYLRASWRRTFPIANIPAGDG